MLQEFKKYNIRTYSIAPGSIKTPMGKKVENQNFETFIDPEEIAKFIIDLISFDNEMISDEVRINRFNL